MIDLCLIWCLGPKVYRHSSGFSKYAEALQREALNVSKDINLDMC